MELMYKKEMKKPCISMKKSVFSVSPFPKPYYFFVRLCKITMNFYLSAEYQFVNPVQNDVLFGTKSLFCVQNAFLCLFVRIVRFCTKIVQCVNI